MAWNDLSNIEILWRDPMPKNQEGVLTSFLKGYTGAKMAKKERVASEEESYAAGIAETGTGEGVKDVNRGFAFEDFAKGFLGYGSGGPFDKAQLYRKADEIREQQVKNQSGALLLRGQQEALREKVANQNAAGSVEIGNIISTVGEYNDGWLNPEFQSKVYGAMAKTPGLSTASGIYRMVESEIKNAEALNAKKIEAEAKAKLESEKRAASAKLQQEKEKGASERLDKTISSRESIAEKGIVSREKLASAAEQARMDRLRLEIENRLLKSGKTESDLEFQAAMNQFQAIQTDDRLTSDAKIKKIEDLKDGKLPMFRGTASGAAAPKPPPGIKPPPDGYELIEQGGKWFYRKIQ